MLKTAHQKKKRVAEELLSWNLCSQSLFDSAPLCVYAFCGLLTGRPHEHFQARRGKHIQRLHAAKTQINTRSVLTEQGFSGQIWVAGERFTMLAASRSWSTKSWLVCAHLSTYGNRCTSDGENASIGAPLLNTNRPGPDTTDTCVLWLRRGVDVTHQTHCSRGCTAFLSLRDQPRGYRSVHAVLGAQRALSSVFFFF